MSQQPHFGFAIEYVNDVAKAKAFYVDVLGLRVEREAPTFVQFEHFAVASDESMDGHRDIELFWLVDDAEAEFNALRGKAQVTRDLATLPFGKIFGVRGPSGEPRYLLELATNRPSKKV